MKSYRTIFMGTLPTVGAVREPPQQGTVEKSSHQGIKATPNPS